MKKLIAIFLGFVLTIGLCSCGAKESSSDSKNPGSEIQNPSNTPAANTPEPQQTQKDVKIIITPPEGWNPVTGSVLPVQYMKKTASFMVKSENFSGENLDDVVKEAKSAFEGAFEGVKYIGETEKIVVGGIEAQKMIFTCKISGMQMKYEYVYLFAGGKVYAITFGDLDDTFDSLSSDYEQILNDIKFE